MKDLCHRRSPSIRVALKPLVTACLALSIGSLPAAAIDWPQQIEVEEVRVIVYQPQPEKLDGNVLSGRAAMSLELVDRKEPIFGVFWFEAILETDTGAGTALIHAIEVTNVRWPESTDASEQRFTAVVEAAIPESGFEISLDRLSASLETAELEQKSLANLKNDPPVIVFRRELAVLLMYDGEPRFSPVENSVYARALNTPFVVVRNKDSGSLYLSSGEFWYTASDALGPWTPTQSPPQDLVAMIPKPESDGSEQPALEAPPAIVTASEPTELIVTQGPPKFQSLPGGALVYAENTETPWLRELSTNNMYVLLSGRWYRSSSESGPWTFVRADELPASFQQIPPESDIGGIRTSVAGTEEANDAVLDAHIPQTAAINRNEASLEVEYDGEARFERIAGTSVAYAVNTGAQVLQIADRYYAVDDGVWFTSSAAMGPWAVADSVPEEEIGKIPPSSPVYNTTHVHVYQSTPEVVYVGYTPGYVWSFPYYGVPVYGTGWYYPPYLGRYYYPRTPTWGFHVGYNPWTGWSFGMSWSNGFFSFGVGWGGGWGGAYRPWGCCGGWYGGGYHHTTVVRRNTKINIGNTVNIGNRTNIGNRIGRNQNDLARSRSHANLYSRDRNRGRVANPANARPNIKRASPIPNRANDVFADRNGNVARRANTQWQSRQNGQWRPPAQNRITPQTQQRIRSQQGLDSSSLNRANMARQRGMQRQAARPVGFGGARMRRR